MNSIGWVGDVSVGPCLLPPAGSCPPPSFPATECQGQGGESCSSPMVGGRRQCWLLQAGEEKPWYCAGLRELRRVWVRVVCLLTATVSGQQAPAPPTAMPAVPRLAEVIMLES